MKKLHLENLAPITGGKVSILSLTSSFCLGAMASYIYQELEMPKKKYIRLNNSPSKTMQIGNTTIRIYDLN